MASEAGAAGAAGAARPSLRQLLASPKMLVLMALGAASGFPNQVTESALQAWLKDVHVSNTQIGIVSYVAIPYLLKFLWAPLLDRYPLPLLGRRRGWILVAQALLAATMALLALQNPAASLIGITVCALAIVFFSATQDIVIDAYRADVAHRRRARPGGDGEHHRLPRRGVHRAGAWRWCSPTRSAGARRCWWSRRLMAAVRDRDRRSRRSPSTARRRRLRCASRWSSRCASSWARRARGRCWRWSCSSSSATRSR